MTLRVNISFYFSRPLCFVVNMLFTVRKEFCYQSEPFCKLSYLMNVLYQYCSVSADVTGFEAFRSR